MESIIRQEIQVTLRFYALHHTWLEAATGDTLASFKTTMLLSDDFITNWTTEWSNTMKWMLDDLSNYLIFFALPVAQFRNKALLEKFFSKHNCESIVLNVELFNILLNIDNSSIRERPTPTATVTTVNTSNSTFFFF